MKHPKSYLVSLQPHAFAEALALLEERCTSTRGGMTDTAAHAALEAFRRAKAIMDSPFTGTWLDE